MFNKITMFKNICILLAKSSGYFFFGSNILSLFFFINILKKFYKTYTFYNKIEETTSNTLINMLNEQDFSNIQEFDNLFLDTQQYIFISNELIQINIELIFGIFYIDYDILKKYINFMENYSGLKPSSYMIDLLKEEKLNQFFRSIGIPDDNLQYNNSLTIPFNSLQIVNKFYMICYKEDFGLNNSYNYKII